MWREGERGGVWRIGKGMGYKSRSRVSLGRRLGLLYR